MRYYYANKGYIEKGDISDNNPDQESNQKLTPDHIATAHNFGKQIITNTIPNDELINLADNLKEKAFMDYMRLFKIDSELVGLRKRIGFLIESENENDETREMLANSVLYSTLVHPTTAPMTPPTDAPRSPINPAPSAIPAGCEMQKITLRQNFNLQLTSN